MTSILKKSFLMALACICVGTYGVVEAQGAMDAQTKVSKTLEMSVEAAVPGIVMPSPVHVFTTVKEAAEYMNITPQMPKLLPVGFNIQSVIKIYYKLFMSMNLVRIHTITKLAAHILYIAHLSYLVISAVTIRFIR